MRRRAAGLVLMVFMGLAPSSAWADCETYWVGFFGKEEPEHLTHSESWPLLRFATHTPSWYPDAYDESGRYIGPAAHHLRWDALPTPAPLARVAAMDGRHVYVARYSPRRLALVWDQGGWLFCPALVIDADEGIVYGVDDPHLFTWQGRQVISLRIFFQGMGALQQSLFFAMVEGRLVHLREEPIWEGAPNLEIHHRGGGFCSESLQWENDGWRTANTTAGGILRVKYRIEGRHLCVDSVEIVERSEAPAGWPCRPSDEAPRGPRIGLKP